MRYNPVSLLTLSRVVWGGREPVESHLNQTRDKAVFIFQRNRNGNPALIKETVKAVAVPLVFDFKKLTRIF